MANFDSYIDTINMEFWHDICAREGELRHYRKGEYFVRHGENPLYMGIVKQGYFKYTVMDSDGNEHISGFSLTDTFVGDYLNATRKIPTMTNIVAVTDADVLVCNCNVLTDVFRNDKDLHQLFADSLFHQIYGVYLDTHCLSPKERYTRLLKRCPSILHDITLKELASYLQITPTHLSRIRKEITFGKE